MALKLAEREKAKAQALADLAKLEADAFYAEVDVTEEADKFAFVGATF